MRSVLTFVFVVGLYNWLLVHYAYCQRPLSAANQTTPILPLPPDGTTPRGGNGLGNGVSASNGLNTRRLQLGLSNKTMSGITRSFNPNNAAGSVPGKGVASKLTDEELSNKIKNRILKPNRLKPIRGGNGTVESESEVPIGLPPLVDVDGTLALDSLPPLPEAPPVDPPAKGGLGDIAGGVSTYSRPLPGDRKSSKNKILDLMNASQFPSGNVNKNPSNSQRHRNKSNKFQELRNITRQNAQLGRYNSKPDRPEPSRVQFEQHINILPVKSNPAKTLQFGMDEDAREEVRFPDDTGNDSESDGDVFHSKYHEHPEAEAEDDLQWSMRNNTKDPLSKIKWRVNKDHVS